MFITLLATTPHGKFRICPRNIAAPGSAGVAAKGWMFWIGAVALIR
jgi:hypothetical protein